MQLVLLNTVFDAYCWVVVLRILFQWGRVGIHNPICQFVIKATQPILSPLQRVLPVYRSIDMAVVGLLIALEALKVVLLYALQNKGWPHVTGVVVLVPVMILALFMKIYYYGVILRAIMSWINPLNTGAFSEVVYVLVEPVLRSIRAIVPPLGGFDLSVLFVIIGMYIANLLLVSPLIELGSHLAVG